MKETILTAIIISALLLSLTVSMNPHPAKAESTGYIQFVDSGVTVYSPLNTTYNYRNLTLNVTLSTVGFVTSYGGPVTTISMNYSIDGIYVGQVPLWANVGTHVIISGYGIAGLPELPDGSHRLTLYLYGYNMQSYQPQFKSYVNTVYFSTVGNSLRSRAPTVPEFSSIAVILTLLVAVSVAMLVMVRKSRK